MSQTQGSAVPAGCQRTPVSETSRERRRLVSVAGTCCACHEQRQDDPMPCPACVVLACMRALWAQDDAQAVTA